MRIKSWEIYYYFSGPDLRYNGTHVRIPGAEIEEYISAYKENWNEYNILKSKIPEGGKFEKIGAKSMSIRIGGYKPGVCITSYHMPINSESQLLTTIDVYVYAQNKATKIQDLLKVL